MFITASVRIWLPPVRARHARPRGCSKPVPLLLAGATLLLPGCAPRVVLERPPTWPQRWSDRDLYHTPQAYIYASSAAVAGEADRLVAAVAREFALEAGQPVEKGVVFVNAPSDKLFVADWKTLLALQEREAQAADPNAPPETPEQRWERISGEAEQAGLGMDLLLMMTPVGLDRTQLRELVDLPQQASPDAAWGAILPTRALLREAFRRQLKAAYEREKIGPAMQLALAPIVALMEPKLVDALAAVRDIAVYAAMAASCEGWSAQQRESHLAAYKEKKVRAAMGALRMAAPASQAQPEAEP
jgi:hypothetical protein